MGRVISGCISVSVTPRGSPELITQPDYFTVCYVNRAYPAVPIPSLNCPLLIPHCPSRIDAVIRQYLSEPLSFFLFGCLYSFRNHPSPHAPPAFSQHPPIMNSSSGQPFFACSVFFIASLFVFVPSPCYWPCPQRFFLFLLSPLILIIPVLSFCDLNVCV